MTVFGITACKYTAFAAFLHIFLHIFIILPWARTATKAKQWIFQSTEFPKPVAATKWCNNKGQLACEADLLRSAIAPFLCRFV